MTQLVRYEAARTALAEAHHFDEVKEIRDKAEAMAAYARQAKDQDLILWATEIKVRAERKCGAMLAESAEHGERATRAGNVNPATRKVSSDTTPSVPTLADIGITRDQSSRYQQLASMTDEHFEAAVATAKDTAGQVTTAFMLREAAKGKNKPLARKPTKRDKERLQELQEAKARGVSMLTTYARLTLTALRASADFSEEEMEVLTELGEAISEVGATA